MTIKEFIKELNIRMTGVIQVGANRGQELQDYIDLGLRDMILFEPLEEEDGHIKNKVNKIPSIYYDSIDIVRKACGNFNGKSKLHESNNIGMSSSLLKPKIHLQQYPGVKFIKEIEVDVVRLDDYVKDKEKYDFLGIDVQGYELEVLKGSTNLLENHIKIVQAEVNSVELYEGGVLIDDLEKFLEPFGFKRVFCTRDVDFMKENSRWADAVYVKGS